MSEKRVYKFGNGQAEGNAQMRNLLGGKGANLAEMNLLGVPVPPGFTITTDVCNEYYQIGRDKVVAILKNDVEGAIRHIEKLMNSKFGDVENPLLVSVRSGARASMPGMMDTILNLGLNDEVVEGLSRKTNNPHFAWDSYRRFVQMYGDVVLGMKPLNKTDVDPFEAIIEKVKEEGEKRVERERQYYIKRILELQDEIAALKKEVQEKGNEIMTLPIHQLPLSPVLMSILLKAGYYTLEDVAKEDLDALKALPGMTNDMLRIIRKCIELRKTMGQRNVP